MCSVQSRSPDVPENGSVSVGHLGTAQLSSAQLSSSPATGLSSLCSGPSNGGLVWRLGSTLTYSKPTVSVLYNTEICNRGPSHFHIKIFLFLQKEYSYYANMMIVSIIT